MARSGGRAFWTHGGAALPAGDWRPVHARGGGNNEGADHDLHVTRLQSSTFPQPGCLDKHRAVCFSRRRWPSGKASDCKSGALLGSGGSNPSRRTNIFCSKDLHAARGIGLPTCLRRRSRNDCPGSNPGPRTRFAAGVRVRRLRSMDLGRSSLTTWNMV